MAHFSPFPPTSMSIDAVIAVDSGDRGSGFRVTESTIAGKKRIQRHCNEFLVADGGPNNVVSARYGLVMVNSETMDATLAQRWWSICEYKICADGGANRLFDGLFLSGEASKYIPDVVKGDLDSLRDDVKQFYIAAGCAVVHDRDQDHNDLDKCLQTLQKHWYIDRSITTPTADTTDTTPPSSSSPSASPTNNKPTLPTTVIILGAFGGRFDQEVASIHALYKWRTAFDRVVLVGGGNVACLLDPGTHRLDPVGAEGPVCALLPVGGPVRSITTRGLQWDMTDQRMELGGLISSSNSLLPVGGVGQGTPRVTGTTSLESASGTTRTAAGTGIGNATGSSGKDEDASMNMATDVDSSRSLSRRGDVDTTKRYQSVLVETSDPVLWMTTTTTTIET